MAAGVIALNGGEGWKEEGVQETGELGGKRLSTAILVNRCACARCEIRTLDLSTLTAVVKDNVSLLW